MRRSPASTLLAGALLLLLAGPAHARSFAIERFAVVLRIEADGDLAVQEALTIEFRGRYNGVFRTIPARYERGGFTWTLRLEDVVVLDEAHRPLRTEVTYPGRYARIRAWVPGAEDTTRTVRLVYRVRRGLLAFEDHDELYWNVTGDEWDVPIRSAEAEVRLPPGVDPVRVRALAFTGPAGTAGADYVEERGDGVLAFRTTRPLRPREGLTIAVGWPSGLVARPTVARQAWWLLQDNWALGLPALTLAFTVLAWRRWGRDPLRDRSIKPEYEPPPGLAPAEAGTLVDERAEPRDVLATLVDLAVCGALVIERQEDGDFVFRPVKSLADDPSLTMLERTVLQRVFGQDLSLRERSLGDLRRDTTYVFPPLRDAIYRSMVARRLFPSSPHGIRLAWSVPGVLLLLAVVPLVLPEVTARYGWSPAVGLAGSGLVLLRAARAMPRRTWRGARALLHVRGFQEFLARAERDRLERLPSDTLHRWLPWAMALGVIEPWIWSFEGIAVDPPDWYRGSEPFTLASYRRDLDDLGRRPDEAVATGARGGGAGDSGLSGGSSGGRPGGGGGGTF